MDTEADSFPQHSSVRDPALVGARSVARRMDAECARASTVSRPGLAGNGGAAGWRGVVWSTRTRTRTRRGWAEDDCPRLAGATSAMPSTPHGAAESKIRN